MALIGRLHPLLVHFPIALVMVAAAFEAAAMVTKDELWRTAAVVNVRAAAAFGLLLLMGYALSWVGVVIGLSVRAPEAAATSNFLWLFPLTFLSNAFVAPSTLPTVLRWAAEWNPLSATVQATRQLFGNPGLAATGAWPAQHPVLVSLSWSVLIAVVGRTLAVRRYRAAGT